MWLGIVNRVDLLIDLRKKLSIFIYLDGDAF
jgi:hypothetical protein